MTGTAELIEQILRAEDERGPYRTRVWHLEGRRRELLEAMRCWLTGDRDNPDGLALLARWGILMAHYRSAIELMLEAEQKRFR